MDGNKDESNRCVFIAQKYINEGDRTKALKFLYKAEKLFPSQRAKDLIELLEKLSDSTGDKSQYSNENDQNEQNFSRSPSARRRTAKNTESVKVEYTEEQVEAVARIKKCKDFYEILGVSKDAGESDLKKQYKKLALQFHPDKNKAPGATEAFKAIGNAFAVLSDPEKKKQYDTFGSSDTKSYRRPAYQRQHEYYEYSRGFESDISAEELFNMFFGGGFPSGMAANTYPRRPQHRRFPNRDAHHARQETQANYTVVMQMLPLIFLILISLLSSFLISDPSYSLSKTQKYAYERRTSNLKVPYFVKENFATEYQGSIRRLEAQVEEEYIANLRGSCFKEKNYRDSMIWRARNFRDRTMEDNAKALKTPSCETLNELYTNERGW